MLFFILCLFFKIINSQNLEAQIDLSDYGKLEGTTRQSYQGLEYYSFEGVPYARPPIGKYRFREPSYLKPWQGIWQAKTIYKCMQKFQYTPPGEDFVIGDEDCLYLNIYTPSLDPRANLDVLVYIHGGAFMFNWGGIYQPDYIIDKNLVSITINYRLGPLGFLSTENDIVPGNNGLKDQIFALEWINKNVHLFGGNPSSITIMGMSAGGASVNFHYLSPKSRGLFQRGISESGVLLNSWALTEKPLEKSKKLAAIVGCPTKLVKEMVDCLKRRSARQIVKAVEEFQPWLYNPFSPFGPVVDSWSLDSILPDYPYNLLKKHKVADLPWMISYVNSEGLYPAFDFYHEKYLDDIDKRWNELLPLILDYNHTVDRKNQDLVSEKIREYYLGDKTVNKENYLDFVKIISERMFTVDIEKTIRLQNSAMKSNIFFYYFTYRGAHSKSESRTGTNKDFGASHGDDTAYIFKTDIDTTSTKNDRLMIELLTEIVASFAKTGTPNAPIDWVPLPKNSALPLKYLKIASPTDIKMENSVLNSTDFWASLPIRENEKLSFNVKDEL